jgi:hypothetical protein
MAQDKRTFMGGMNKDVDVRLIKNPDYINALNVRVISSTDGTIGSLENIEGNEEVPFNFYSTDQDVHFINDNGLYEQINPSTVFYQKVIRIQGWEQVNVNYNFSLYSVSLNGNILIGEFNWTGGNAHVFTSQYLNSQFGGVGNYNSGITVYDSNTGSEYTASVKLLAFGSNAPLNGGYFDIVIECDTPGVNFSLSASSSFYPDEFSYSYSDDSSIPISSNENVSISLLPSFETGGSYNADATDQGFVISPDGQPYQVDNRTVWVISFVGSEPTTPASFGDFDEINVYSYRSNLNPGEQNENFESRVLFTINTSLFSSGAAHEFDSNQNNLAEFLHTEFSESKVILCDGLPLDFNLPSDNFFLTFSETQSFDNSITFKVLVVGPVGVRFKLALGDSSETLHQALSNADDLDISGVDFSALFNNGSFIALNAHQIVENSISITDSIVSTFDAIQAELNITLSLYNDLTVEMMELITNNGNLQSQLDYQITLTATAQANLAQTQADLDSTLLTNEELASSQQNLQNLNQQQGALIESQITQISSLQNDLDDLQDSYTALEGTLLDEEATSSEYYTQLIACQSDIASMTISHADTIANIQATLGAEIDDLNVLNSNLQAALDGANELNISLIEDQADIENAHAAQLNDIAITHQAQIDAIILDYSNQLDFQEVDYESQIVIIQYEAQAALDAANALAQSQIAELNDQIDSLNDDLDYQTMLILDDSDAIQALNTQISELQEQISNLVISDLIIETTLQNYDDLYTSLSNLYSNSFSVFNALSITNASVYEEDFSSVSDFSNEWVFYNVDYMFFEEIPSPITDVSGGSYSNALLDVENDGYLKIPTRADNYTAARLPYNSFQSPGGWQHGSEIAITLTFDVVNNTTTSGEGYWNYLPAIKARITNMWDNTGEFDYGPMYDDRFFIEYDIVPNNGGNGQYNVVNPDPFSYTHTVVNDNLNNFLDRLCNITIIVDPVPNTDIEVRLTDIRLGNTAQEMFSFNLTDTVPIREESYLELYNEYNTYVLDWRNSTSTMSLEEYVGSSQYSQILNRVISGYNDNPNLSQAYTVGGRLQRYADAVISFSSSVQTQVYQQYLSYTVATGLVPEDVSDVINLNDQQIQILQSELEAAQAEIEQLEENLLESSGAFLTGPNVGASLISIYGNIAQNSPDTSPDTSVLSSSDWSFSQYLSQDYTLPITFRIDGEDVNVAELVLLTSDEVTAMYNNPYSETNNIVYYLTNRFQNGQEVEFNLPGNEYGPQKGYMLLANFDENSSTLAGETPFISITAGIDLSLGGLGSLVDEAEELYNLRALQLIFYFDQSIASNVGTEDYFFHRLSTVADKNIFTFGIGSDFNDIQVVTSPYTYVSYYNV